MNIDTTNKKHDHKLLYRSCLIIASIIWGFAFAFQTMGIESMPPIFFNALRTYLAGIVVIPVMLVYNKINPQAKEKLRSKNQLKAGLVCGLFLGIASAIQQYGLVYTSSGKSSFITALYIIMVPIIGIFLRKKAGRNVWIAAVVALIGMYFLCISGHSMINRGDVLTFACAIFFALQILSIDRYADEVNMIMLSVIQFFTAGTISLILALIARETFTYADLVHAAIPFLYTGIASGGIAYTLQIVGQSKTPPAMASILMSGESVFGAIGGFLILGQKMSPIQIIGCGLMFAAIILAQIPGSKS